MDPVQRAFQEHRRLLDRTLDHLAGPMHEAARMLAAAYRGGGKVLLFGNGGSAAETLHVEGELLGRFRKDREGLAAIALGGGIGALTACANDFGYGHALARLLRAQARGGDLVFLYSTSGRSENILAAAEAASEMGLQTVGFTGRGGGSLHGLVNCLLDVPSEETPRIQEMHLLLGHVICDLVERELFGE